MMIDCVERLFKIVFSFGVALREIFQIISNPSNPFFFLGRLRREIIQKLFQKLFKIVFFFWSRFARNLSNLFKSFKILFFKIICLICLDLFNFCRPWRHSFVVASREIIQKFISKLFKILFVLCLEYQVRELFFLFGGEQVEVACHPHSYLCVDKFLILESSFFEEQLQHSFAFLFDLFFFFTHLNGPFFIWVFTKLRR